jgi:hypothetical protein
VALLRKSAFKLTVPFPVALLAMAAIAALPSAEELQAVHPLPGIG